jgi:hypothetical protein
VISFTILRLYNQKKSLWYQLDGREGWVGSRAGLEVVVKRTVSDPAENRATVVQPVA